jgi:hypothetical protein
MHNFPAQGNASTEVATTSTLSVHARVCVYVYVWEY